MCLLRSREQGRHRLLGVGSKKTASPIASTMLPSPATIRKKDWGCFLMPGTWITSAIPGFLDPNALDWWSPRAYRPWSGPCTWAAGGCAPETNLAAATAMQDQAPSHTAPRQTPAPSGTPTSVVKPSRSHQPNPREFDRLDPSPCTIMHDLWAIVAGVGLCDPEALEPASLGCCAGVAERLRHEPPVSN